MVDNSTTRRIDDKKDTNFIKRRRNLTKFNGAIYLKQWLFTAFFEIVGKEVLLIFRINGSKYDVGLNCF